MKDPIIRLLSIALTCLALVILVACSDSGGLTEDDYEDIGESKKTKKKKLDPVDEDVMTDGADDSGAATTGKDKSKTTGKATKTTGGKTTGKGYVSAVKELPYNASKQDKLKDMERQVLDYPNLPAGGGRKLENKVIELDADAFPVLLNAFRQIDLESEDGKMIGQFVTGVLERMTAMDDPPIFNITRSGTKGGRNACRIRWFQMFHAGELKVSKDDF